MAAAQPSGGSQSPEVKTQPTAGGVPGVPLQQGSRSVLEVSQLLLGAIAAHGRPTLAALRKQLGSAGYEVRRKLARRAADASRPETKGTLLRVTGSDAAGYFRIWKVPKPKRKPGRPRLGQSGCSCERTSPRPRRPRRRRSKRKAAKKARDTWRRKARAEEKARRARLKARVLARGRASVRARARGTGQERGQTSRDRPRSPRSQKERRPSSKRWVEKRREPEREEKRTIQSQTVVVSAECTSDVQKKARTKTSTKADAPKDAVPSPSGALAGPSGQ